MTRILKRTYGVNLSKNYNIHWIEEILNDFFRDRLEKDSKRRFSSFHPSQIGVCSRAIWYSLKGYPKQLPFSISSQRFSYVGRAFHQMFEDAFKNSEYFHSSEGKLRSSVDDIFSTEKLDISVSGNFDLVVIRPFDKEKYLIEIKTRKDRNDNIYDDKYKSWEDLNESETDHVLQWQIYSFFSKINIGCILYINRNNLKFKIFEQKRNDLLINKALDKYRLIYKFVKKNKTYPFQPDENHKFCLYSKQCQLDYFKETGDEGYAIFGRSIPKGIK